MITCGLCALDPPKYAHGHTLLGTSLEVSAIEQTAVCAAS
jgi:hypothetical protein